MKRKRSRYDNTFDGFNTIKLTEHRRVDHVNGESETADYNSSMSKLRSMRKRKRKKVMRMTLSTTEHTQTTLLTYLSAPRPTIDDTENWIASVNLRQAWMLRNKPKLCGRDMGDRDEQLPMQNYNLGKL